MRHAKILRSMALLLIVVGLSSCSPLDPQRQPDDQPLATSVPASPPPQTGAVFHVTTDGSDTNDGSLESPWATLQHAVDTIGPGEAVVVHEGTYSGLRIESSGELEAWKSLRAADGERVILNVPGPQNVHESIVEVETWEADEAVSYWIIEGFEVTGAPGWGIDLRGSPERHAHHLVVRGNLVHENGLESGKTGIFAAFVDDLVIEGNESFLNGEHGIYLSNSGDRFWVDRNRLYENVFCGLHVNGDESQGGDGLISGGIVERNIIYENGQEGCSAINFDGVTDAVVRNNLVYSNHSGGISLFQENGARCSSDNRILHNTIVMAQDGRWAINISHPSCTGNQIFNNIILTRHEWRGSILIPDPGIEGFESDYNILVNRFSADDDKSVIALDDWQNLGYDRHSILGDVDELFMDPGAGDFRLRLEGPAVDRGVTLPDVNTDLAGTVRPRGEFPDPGAFEANSQDPALESAPPSASSQGLGGVVTYTLGERVFRLEAQPGAEPVDISEQLDGLSAGTFDELLNMSPDGGWLLVETDRFDLECQELGSCLVLLLSDLSQAEVIRTQGQPLDWEGMAAVSSSGDLIVYSSDGGPHTLDLWAVSRAGDGWGAPLLLSADSPFEWNHQPAVSPDGKRVVFDCGPEAYGAEGTAICQASTDGLTAEVLIGPANSPPGYPNTGALHHPDYAPDGSIVFEADWDGEQIWRLTDGAFAPTLVGSEFSNDNSPCVLPDGRIVSLWLGRAGIHELKVMDADGHSYFMLLTGQDVADIGIGCGS